MDLQGSLQGLNGWQATAYTEGISARELVNCPGLSCPGGSTFFQGTYPTFNSGAVVLRIRCGAAGGCSNNALGGQIYVHASSVTLSDGSAPTVTPAGGSLLSGGWKNGTQSVTVRASDNIGVQAARVLVDGALASSVGRSCDFSQGVPCSNGDTDLQVPVAGLADGAHAITVQAVDASGNVGSVSSGTVYVDNIAPTQPLEARVTGGTGWRARNSFELQWRNPAQTSAPIAGAAYRLCPTLAADADAQMRTRAQAQCVQGSRNGTNLTTIKDLALPNPGSWDLRLWLVDAAGNQQPASAVEIDGLGYDDAPPTDVAFGGADPANPTQVHVQVTDSVSGIASGVIEVRHDGQDAWQPLATQVSPTGLTAALDDENLPKGLYFLRARVVDAAGLESSDDRTGDGQPAMAKLPIRLASRVTAGRRGHRTCRGRGTHRSCRYRLATKPTIRVGRATRLYGRLTVAGKSMPATPVQIWRQLDQDGATWGQIGTVTTSKTGRFSYRAPRGPARTIRFRYPGSALIRGRNGDVALRVRASATLRSSRRTVINGESIVFRGKLQGGWIPAAGALVELQVRSRGEWRTFAQPRARAKTGRFAYRYRFETVRGRATFKFRARIRRQPGYPFTTGTSHATRVTVRGL